MTFKTVCFVCYNVILHNCLRLVLLSHFNAYFLCVQKLLEFNETMQKLFLLIEVNGVTCSFIVCVLLHN